MIPTASEILAAFTAACKAAEAYFTWLLTPEGKAFSQKAMQDRGARDKFWTDAGTGLAKFFRGEFFK
jgi:hypothetical protein